MTRPFCLQIYISRELGERIAKVARARDLSMSHWAMSHLHDACENDELALHIGTPIDRIARQSLFAMIGIDALLAGHADPQLRERAHQAYARKCEQLGIISRSGKPNES